MSEQVFMSLKDMVTEIRTDVKDLRLHLDRIDREGSIGTRAELVDHESRLRILERSGSMLTGAWGAVLGVLALLGGLSGIAATIYTFAA